MYEELKQIFFETYSRPARFLFSAPGRTEIGGNHTDHQLGRVLAGAVSVDTVAAVDLNSDGVIRVLSEGYPLCTIDLDELQPRPEEVGTTAALIRGVAAGISAVPRAISGFDACVSSRVLPGSGLSSSAAFEVLIGTIINELSGCQLDAIRIAQIGQFAENVFFGKPCGLMDQMASSVGGIVTIDFADRDKPLVEPLHFDFASCGHALCIINSGADHADLTDEYASIPRELKEVCAVFGMEVLREVDEAEFYARLPEVRKAAGDRAAMRAMHVFDDNRRVSLEVEALKAGDFDRFLELVNESGRSSWLYLQNVVPTGNTAHQELAMTLALAAKLLGGRGACRVHGGGFAGTIQAFVPMDLLEEFRAGMDAVLGQGACQVLSIRPEGGIKLEEVKA